MWLRLLRSTEWGQLLDFVTPAFFEVLPARALARQARSLLASTRDAAGFEAAARRLGARLEERKAPLQLDPAARKEWGRAPAPARGREARIRRGQLVLRLYFETLLGGDAALLDLRGASFRARADGLVWSPARAFVRWDPEFLAGVRRMYRGFYEGEDAAFREGLTALGLEAAADLFLRHFGEGDQSAVHFETKHFVASFHDVFLRCRESGVRLHGDFVPLGILLAALYEHLEPLGVALDVRRAFREASA